MSTALLFDRDRVEEVAGWESGLPRIGRSAVLWIDLERPDESQIRTLVDRLGLENETQARLASRTAHPALSDHGTYLHVTVLGLSDRSERRTSRVECLVSKRWLLTIRESSVEVVDRFREVATGSGETGRLDGLGLLANLIEWALTSFMEAFEELERQLEEIDARAMGGEMEGIDGAVVSLVEMRREVGRLRRALVAHRHVVLALARPELEALGSTDAAERFVSLRDRLEDAVQAARDVRESIVGSFDVVIAMTGQRTNEVMKVLTLASVLLLPGALVAGLMGMNFKLGIFESSAYFWVVLASIVLVASATLVGARLRRWI